MNQRYDELRNTYPEFIYHKFETEDHPTGLRVTWHFEVPGLTDFHPIMDFPIKDWPILNDPSGPMAETVLFSIGMVELVSYWKIACPPKVIVEAGSLSPEQIVWWKDLYFNGLGEFFFTNDISPTQENFMTIVSEGPAAYVPEVFRQSDSQIIPIGGGKDSIVTIEHLASDRDKNFLFGINPTQASLDTMEVAAYDDSKRLLVRRSLDSEMLRLNREGFLNGHTPFSALLAFVSYYCAYVIGAKYIVLSNEASANAATVQGTEINHQYSKTSQFEIAFQNYVKEYLEPEIFYFSLMRPFAELAIAKSFTQYPQYFPVFRSCNVGSKKNIWCGQCSKCLFVYTILAPFLPKPVIEEIFGSDLWDNEALTEDWAKLLGAVDVKPFECVGTVEEVQYAVYLYLKNTPNEAASLPLLLRQALAYAKNGRLSQLALDEENNLLSLSPEDPLAKWHTDERVPDRFRAVVADLVTEGRRYAE